MKNILVLLLLFVATTTNAGLYLAEPVVVDLINRSASGDMWSARYSDQSDSFIGCGVTSVSAELGGGQFAFCQAQDAAGVSVFCAINDPALIESVQAMTSDVVLRFQWNTANECTVVNVSAQSYSIRRRPNN